MLASTMPRGLGSRGSRLVSSLSPTAPTYAVTWPRVSSFGFRQEMC